IGLGGNFARATPDSALVENALRRLKLTVHIATKPNEGLGRAIEHRSDRGKDIVSMFAGNGEAEMLLQRIEEIIRRLFV
ncbi:hypothetical protein AB9F45_39125, partial [Rhizobium leguminosarum]|uniref:hypothetical protein n=1 Tax=Rhizobium leguminosarum TaxID=384 RepID=UPI003F9849B8